MASYRCPVHDLLKRPEAEWHHSFCPIKKLQFGEVGSPPPSSKTGGQVSARGTEGHSRMDVPDDSPRWCFPGEEFDNSMTIMGSLKRGRTTKNPRLTRPQGFFILSRFLVRSATDISPGHQDFRCSGMDGVYALILLFAAATPANPSPSISSAAGSGTAAVSFMITLSITKLPVEGSLVPYTR